MSNETYTQSGTDSLLEHLRRATIGRYDVYAELGTGGMASVFLALDLALDRKVAIKVMSPALANSTDNIERFKREAKVAASLNHPNIIGILAVGDDPDLAYFVMKYVEGRSLESVIKESGAQTVPFVQTIIGAAGKALHYAHTRGVIHRDVKPANFMLDQDGWLIVTDFGIAKMEDTKGLTMTGSIIGTPYYMSPEQFHGKPVTGAADQYALGIVAHELLTGKQPYTGETIAEVMRGHLFDDIPSVRAVKPEIPEELDACVQRMMAKDPKDRFPTLEEAVMAFGSVPPKVEVEVRTQIISLAKSGMLQQPRISTPLSPVPAQRPPKAQAAKTKQMSPAESPARRPRPEVATEPAPKSRGWIAALVLLLLGAGGATAWLKPELLSNLRARIAGAPAAPAPGFVDSTAIRDSIQRAQLAAQIGDSIRREDSIARVLARADSIVRADSIARVIAARNAAARRNAPRTPATTPATTPASTPATSSIPTAGLGNTPPPSSIPTAGNTGAASAASKDGNTTRTTPQSTIPTAGVPPTPAQPTATGPGTIRIGSRIPLAVLYIGDEVRPIGERGLQTLTFPSGPVTISIRAENCTRWDTTFTVVAGETHTIGYRPSRC